MSGLWLARRPVVSFRRACLSLSSTRFASIIRKPDSGHSPGASNRTKLPDEPARTRFAPSPTGYLHLGSLRTALFCYLLARATNGQSLLRLEDTDQSRIVGDAESRLYEDLRWAGLSWDEGPDCGGPYGPYKQSERLPIYREHADRLLEQGHAFRCFCSHEDLAAHQKESLQSDGSGGLYPGTCLNISAEESAERAARGDPHTIRFKSSDTPAEVRDIIYGLYRKKNVEDHFIIIKTDGFPTYHFANVVDDHLMKITHVIRGAEWLISTPKHVELYNAFGWKPPKFVHVGLLVDANRQKLSKRNMDIGIDSYRDAHILPPALLNFAALLGWSPSNPPRKGVMTLDEMVENFSLRFTKGDIVVNMEKLAFFQKKHCQLLLQDSTRNTKVINDFMVAPLAKRIREVQKSQQEPDSTASAQCLGAMLADLVPSLGSPLAQMTGSESEVEDYVFRLIKSSRGYAMDVDETIASNRYLLWRIPTETLQTTYKTMMGPTKSIALESQETAPAQLVDHFIRRFDKIDGQSWDTVELQRAVDDTVKGKKIVFEVEGTDGGVDGGWKFLRWALLASDPGPQMVPLLELLGKQETMRRLKAAQEISVS
ncbi:uncharacterized protein E0L32_009342 [Thyridium curvatum]|uniref:Glutamate--tRNA ligase, mitochondrial n=1 Tax=Thyridium curvatum TaxID=1093900 RepID=A0A507ASF1_9PEZI|nr:uncharacterized protein E0L32_009342 [Thyridium curvatum]TPX09454.1 hypothetical protein E0L32_009342 [Thyridium curvatum]